MVGLFDARVDEKIDALADRLMPSLADSQFDLDAAARFVYHELARRRFFLPVTLAYPRLDNLETYSPLSSSSPIQWTPSVLSAVHELIEDLSPLTAFSTGK